MKESIIGKKFNYLIVLRKDESKKEKHSYYYCECVCGTIKSIRKDSIIKHQIKTCQRRKNIENLSVMVHILRFINQ